MKHLEIKLKVMPALCPMRVVISEAAVIQGTKDTKVGWDVFHHFMVNSHENLASFLII